MERKITIEESVPYTGVYFLHRRKVLFLLLSTERKKSVGRISPSERISGEMCRLSG